jgi:type II secretory pathway component PulF
MPVLGPALVAASLARFCKTYVALSRVGYTVVDILAVGSRSVGNSYIEDALDAVRLRITQANDPLPDAFRRQARVFPPDFITATSTAPDNLPAIFDKLGAFYAREAKNNMNTAVALLNPLITVFLGIVVVIVGMALFWPIIAMISSGGK